MQSSRILLFDGSGFRFVETGSQHDLRWACWRNDKEAALVVGNHGTLLEFDGKRFRRIEPVSHENLRGVAFLPGSGEGLAVGNHGTLIRYRHSRASLSSLPTKANLRRVSCRPDGSHFLLVGNDGVVFRYEGGQPERVWGADHENNLRDISWHPDGEEALIVANRYGRDLVASPTLYRYMDLSRKLESMDSTSSDLIGVEWRPDGEMAIAVGYDLVWHEASIYLYEEGGLSKVDLTNKKVYPTAIGWRPDGAYAFIGTASPYGAGHPGGGRLLKYGDHRIEQVFFEPDYPIGNIAWKPDGSVALIIGSPNTRSFTV
ncbi:MAG: hypothetical protein ACE5KH_01865 [Candidatus Geothermarchaeales archaeon]